MSDLAVPFIAGAMSYLNQGQTNQANAQMQWETNKQNEMLTREAWAREDNAVTRRVADLKKNGLSPTLAAGSAAQAQAPIAMGTSRHVASADLGRVASDVVAQRQQRLNENIAMAQIEDIRKSADLKAAQAEVVRSGLPGEGDPSLYQLSSDEQVARTAQSIARTLATDTERSFNEESFAVRLENLLASAHMTEAEREELMYNLEMSRGAHMRTTTHGSAIVNSIAGLIGGARTILGTDDIDKLVREIFGDRLVDMAWEFLGRDQQPSTRNPPRESSPPPPLRAEPPGTDFYEGLRGQQQGVQRARENYDRIFGGR